MLAAQPVGSHVLPTLDDSVTTDASRCGHKAATLARLRQAGFDVPPGFVLPVGAELNGDALAQALAALPGPVAVRSSGVLEDLPDASMAGLYETVLGVEGVDAVRAAIETCRVSGQAERVRAELGTTAPVAVLIQPMVAADAAGVAFSANPVTGDRDEVLVSAVAGLGDKLVGGEVDGDEWSVRGEIATARATPHNSIDADVVRRIAALARRLEDHFGRPQDLEWAVQDGQLILLQSRPITVLPVAPKIVVPSGTWEKDNAHFTGPVSPFGATAYVVHYEPAIDAMISRWGLLPDAVQARVIGHEVYNHVEPDDGGAKPPPWWVLAVVVRLLPSMRRKLAAAQRAFDENLLDRIPHQWETAWKPELIAEIGRLSQIDLAQVDDAALVAHLDDVQAFTGRAMEVHFQVFLPYLIGVHGLIQACEALLDWDGHQAIGLLQGLSVASSAPTRDLTAIAEDARHHARASEIIEAGRPDWVEALRAEAPDIAEPVDAWLRQWGLRTLDYDPGSSSYAEQPTLVASLLAELLHPSEAADLSAQRAERIATARAGLTGAELDRFDTALAYAEKVYPQREDNVFYTDNMAAGLLRRVALEAGRRLVERDRLTRATDALLLTEAELRAALDGSLADPAAVADRARSELAWVRANPGPAVYGTPSAGVLPDLRGLPEAARRVNEAMLWAMEMELTTPEAGEGLSGLAASPGVATGPVRVIRTPDELHRVRPGDIVVCPITTPAWTLIFQRAAGLVTDGGSILSHAAIVAREHGLPAVVATGDATEQLRDGDRITVDGNQGTITRL